MAGKIRAGLAAAAVLAAVVFASHSVSADGGAFRPAGKPPTPDQVEAWARQAREYQASLLPGQSGRFAAVRIDGSSVFLIDTRQGHLWVWTFGEKGSLTAYQGRLLPGLNMGDIVGASPGRTGSQD